MEKTDNLLKTVKACLEQEKWMSAYKANSEILNIDFENSYAYLNKLFIKEKLHGEEDLLQFDKEIDNDEDFLSALKYADDNFKNILMQYKEICHKNYLHKTNEKTYNSLMYDFNSSTSEKQFLELAKKFRELEYKDSEELACQCINKADNIKKYNQQSNYNWACNILENQSEDFKLFEAFSRFDKLGDFKDSEKNKELVLEKIYNLAETAYNKGVSSKNIKQINESSTCFAKLSKLNYKDSDVKAQQCELKSTEISKERKKKTIILSLTVIIIVILCFVCIISYSNIFKSMRINNSNKSYEYSADDGSFSITLPSEDWVVTSEDAEQGMYTFCLPSTSNSTVDASPDIDAVIIYCNLNEEAGTLGYDTIPTTEEAFVKSLSDEFDYEVLNFEGNEDKNCVKSNYYSIKFVDDSMEGYIASKTVANVETGYIVWGEVLTDNEALNRAVFKDIKTVIQTIKKY